MINTRNLTYSALARIVDAVVVIAEADDLTAEQRRDLTTYWALERFRQPDMPVQLRRAINRCWKDPDELRVNATTIISAVSGEAVAYNPGI